MSERANERKRRNNQAEAQAFFDEEENRARQKGFASGRDMHIAQWRKDKEDAVKEAAERDRKTNESLKPFRTFTKIATFGGKKLLETALPGFAPYIDPFLAETKSMIEGSG